MDNEYSVHETSTCMEFERDHGKQPYSQFILEILKTGLKSKTYYFLL